MLGELLREDPPLFALASALRNRALIIWAIQRPNRWGQEAKTKRPTSAKISQNTKTVSRLLRAKVVRRAAWNEEWRLYWIFCLVVSAGGRAAIALVTPRLFPF